MTAQLLQFISIISDNSLRDTGLFSGGAIGSALAVVCSWTRNRSIKWAILAGICNWFYVIYFFFTRTEEEAPK